MSTYIDAETYKDLAQIYADAVAPLVLLIDYYEEAALLILNYSESAPDAATAMAVELDLLRPFNSAYLTANGIYGSLPATAVEAVRALQQHVLDRSGLASLALWYTEVAITPAADLPQEFINLSAAAGYTIS